VMDAPLRAPAGFSLDAYIAKQKAFSYPESPEQMALEIAVHRDVSEHLIERPIAGDQKIGPYAGDRVLLTATVADTAELRWWLLGFGDRVEVLSPRPLRDEFRQIVKTMADRYTSRVRKSGRVS